MSDALALLAGRDFSRADLARRLRGRGHSEEAVEAALERCRELGYLDDRTFARSRAAALLRRRPCGRRALLADLRRQGVPRTMGEQVVDEAIEEAGGERVLAAEAVGRWIDRHGAPADWAAAGRCADHLSRRGFSGAAVQDAMSSWLDELGR